MRDWKSPAKNEMKSAQLQLAILFLAATAAAVAQESTPRIYRSGNEWIEETTGTVTPAKRVMVKTSGGLIHVQGASQSNITYTARKHVHTGSEEAARHEFARMRVFAATSGDLASFRGESDNYSHGSIDFDIQAPAQTSLVKLETGGGVIMATNLQGKVIANTGGGQIHLDEIGSDVSAQSGGGNIEIGKVGGDVKVETGGGNIRIGSAGGQVIAGSGGGQLVIGTGKGMTLQTGGGSIQVDQCTGAMKASTGGGSIKVKEVKGHADVQNGGGAIQVGPIAGGFRAETGSGPIVVDLAASRGNFTDSRIETAAGNIIVYVPDDLGININAAVEVASGVGIRSDFPALKITGGNRQWGPREAFAEGSLNGGGPVLHIHTTTGTIEILRKK